MSTLFHDLRHAARSFGRAKTATAVLLLSLALGTGANAALYSVVDALLFRAPAGIRQPSKLVSLFTSQFNGARHGFTSYPDYVSVKAESAAFRSLAAFDDSRLEAVGLGSSIERVRVVAVSPAFFETLGIEPSAGRLPDADATPTAPPSAVISFALWTTFGRPADAVGRSIHVGGRDFTIAGIAPARFNGLQLGRSCDVWVPLDSVAEDERGNRRLSVIGRLADGVDIDRAQLAVAAVSESLAGRYPDSNRGTRTSADEPRRMTVIPYSRLDPSQRTQIALIGLAVLGATGLLLVSACVNAGTVMLSRSAARRRELAVKVALGASRRLLARQAIVESLFISSSGAALGLLLAYWTAGALPALFAPEEAAMLDTRLNAGVAAVTMLLSCAAGALFAIGPVRHATTTLDIDVLRADSSGISEQAGGAPLRAFVVAGQVALSTVMLIAAGLLFQALTVALEGDLGPAGRGVAVILVKLPGADAGDDVKGIAFHTKAAEAVRKVPGAEAVGWVTTLPVGRGTFQLFEVETGSGLTETVEVDVNVASSGYFHAMRIPVREGRPFTGEDRALTRPVVIINDILARRHFGAHAAGRTLRGSDGIDYEIVGVVGTGKYRTFEEAPEPMVYFPLTQRYTTHLHLVVRTRDEAVPMVPRFRDALQAIDGGVDVKWTMTFEDYLGQALTLDRMTTTVVAGCGLAALALATIGVYGV
ncbi:MAG: ABC transporter permease, partial [Vicinamibacterales bacterium]